MCTFSEGASTLNVVVLISGNGSNLQAIIDEASVPNCPYAVRAVISNNPKAYGLERARKANILTRIVNHRDYPSRDEFELALASAVDEFHPDLLALAGFMRILGAEFVHRYEGRILNIHPSLLPQYPGLDTHARAIADNARQHGASVHFVTTELDGGPIIIQAKVPILREDTPDTLAARVLKEEHRIYPLAIRWFAEGRLSVSNGKVMLDGAPSLH